MSTSDPDLVGRQLRDSDDQPVGTITAAYRYPIDMNAPWGAAAVTHGLILKSSCLVDLRSPSAATAPGGP